MNLEEFSEFFHFFRSEIKLYYNEYNILVGYGIYTISDIIEVIGRGMGGRNPKCAMQNTILGNYWQYPLI